MSRPARFLMLSATATTLLLTVALGAGGNWEANLQDACSQAPSLAGCTLWAACQDGKAAGSFCEPLSLLGSVCSEANGTAACKDYEAECGGSEKGADCKELPPVPNLLTGDAAKAAMKELCWTHYMTQCDKCGGDGTDEGIAKTPCSDPLGTLSSACLEMPGMPECYGLWGMCLSPGVNTSFPMLCLGKLPKDWKPSPSPSPSPASPSPSEDPSPTPSPSPSPAPGKAKQYGLPSRNMTHACYGDPTDPACASFARTDEDAEDDIDSLCHDMPFMIGCTLWNTCQDSETTKASGPLCSPMSIVGDLCKDMPRMKGCEAWVALCGKPGSAVEQCQAPGPVPGVITTFKTRDQIQGMCSTHGMVGCEECVGTSWTTCANPLATIAKLCLGMPAMSDCSDYFAMCSGANVTESFPSICTAEGQADASGGDTIPPMKMYLHQSWTDIILTLNWIPRTKGEMVGAWFACFFSAIFVQALKTWRLLVEAKWARQRRAAAPPGSDCGCGSEPDLKSNGSSGSGSSSSRLAGWQQRAFKRQLINREQFYRNSIRCLFTTVIVFIDYMLMLVVMTFNVAIILFTCVGFGVGALLFGHAGEVSGQPVAEESSPMPADDVERQFVDNGGCCGGKHV